MGARQEYETVVAILQAFVECHTWKQADLARRVEVEPRRIRTVLEMLESSGMPLEREEDHPHVYWSVPQKWFPGGVIFQANDWSFLLQAILNLGDPTHRQRLLSRLLSGLGAQGPRPEDLERLQQAVVARPGTPEEQAALPVIHRCIAERRPLAMKYFSASRGTFHNRVVSPARLVLGPPARLAAHCHKNGELRWFRLENITLPHADPNETFVEVESAVLDAFLNSSPDGYHDESAREVSFLVAPSASSWVKLNLPLGLTGEELPSGELRVSARGGLNVVARFVVGLGADAVAEDEELALRVRQLAQGALERHRA